MCTQNQFAVQVYIKPVYVFTNILLEQLLRTFEVLVMIQSFFVTWGGEEFAELMQILGLNIGVTLRLYCNNSHVAVEWPNVESKFCFYRVST